MPKDNPATTTVNEAAIIALPINLGSGRTGSVLMYLGVAEYFNTPGRDSAASGAATSFIKRIRKAHTRNYYGGDLSASATGKAVTVKSAEFYIPKELKVGGGQAIVVPTELKSTTTAKFFRTTTIRFPANAIRAVISDWLYTNLPTHRPKWFRTETSVKYPVLSKGSITDLNPGNTGTAPPAGG